ncbi:MAG: polysaccharide deacetylase family protein [Spirochaetales bacterium]|nr:polysaccharide deacetylase family protein [Spirochaetales bacterium]
MKKLLVLVMAVVFLQFSCVGTKEVVKEEQKTDVQEAVKYCALTFDDGPDVNKTPLILDKLKAHGVVASFFVVGQRINESTKPILERAVKMGCEINNHSWSYAGMNEMSAEEVKESVDKTTEAIEKYAGVSPKFFRPPNLAISAVMYDKIDLPFAQGVLGMDWDGCNTSAEQRAQNVLKGMMDGAIILLHDVQPDPHPTPEALDILIPELKKQGYQFLTLTELFAKKGVTPNPHEKKMWKYVK